ncbi:Tir chaperone protein (CesT) [Pseudomonas sp. GM102]|uniref:CesT family type III secretion system chaperone n=1 Tax=unclassified Pseudomonas TaxID=196821 RepID=UPI00026F7761|nr:MULTISPECIES: CesT family type III secretion system chaperone [unclassified Pseudomonas]EJM06913.1 Tir chaperone protein (CesT) [Pseudomonas sp. GM102]EJM62209.1 Tir chaperone protein (CesT) [Pseudomonas sp. GM50]
MSGLFYKTLLKDLSTALEMQPLAFDARGMCDLIIDDTYPLKLACNDPHQRLLLIGLLETPKDLPLQRLLGGALNPLVSAGPGLGWDAGSGLYFAYQSIAREKASVAVLMREIATLIDWIKGWREARI